MRTLARFDSKIGSSEAGSAGVPATNTDGRKTNFLPSLKQSRGPTASPANLQADPLLSEGDFALNCTPGTNATEKKTANAATPNGHFLKLEFSEVLELLFHSIPKCLEGIALKFFNIPTNPSRFG
jgi:hypothetical protein